MGNRTWAEEGWSVSDHLEPIADKAAGMMDRVLPDDVDFAFVWRAAGEGTVYRSRGSRGEMANQLKLLLAKLELDEENRDG